eukprot:298138_1
MVDKMKEGRKGKVVEGNENPKWRSAKGGRGLPGENSVKQRHQQGRENTRRGKGGLQEEVPSGLPNLMTAEEKVHGKPLKSLDSDYQNRIHQQQGMYLGDSAGAATLAQARSNFMTLQVTGKKIVETVGIPLELNEWASGLNCSNILLDVKQKSGVKSIYVTDKDAGEREVTVVGTELGSIHMAKLMLETHFRNEVELLRMCMNSSKHQSDLNTFQMEVSHGLHIQFSASPHLIGLMIGKKGVHIKNAEAHSGCTIHVSKAGIVNISGPSPDAVDLAREKFEVLEEFISIGPNAASGLRRNPSKMRELQKESECFAVEVVKIGPPTEMKEVSGVPEIDEPAVEPANDGCVSSSLSETTPWHVRLVGGKLNIANCKIMLEITLDYLEKQQELHDKNREFYQQLRSLQGEFGNTRPTYNSERGGNRGRGRGGWEGAGISN